MEMAPSCRCVGSAAARPSRAPSTRVPLRLASIDPPDDDDSAVEEPDDEDDEGDEDDEDDGGEEDLSARPELRAPVPVPRGDDIMLGELPGESTGKRIVRRVLSTEPPAVEVWFEDSGKMLGICRNGGALCFVGSGSQRISLLDAIVRLMKN